MNTPAPGQETAQAVLDIIRLTPELHNQSEWQAIVDDGPACGTTRCVGGWAVYLHDGEVRLPVVAERARHLLGLDVPDAYRLFYDTTDGMSVHALEYLAKGDSIDWDAVGAAAADDLDPPFELYTEELMLQMWKEITAY